MMHNICPCLPKVCSDLSNIRPDIVWLARISLWLTKYERSALLHSYKVSRPVDKPVTTYNYGRAPLIIPANVS